MLKNKVLMFGLLGAAGCLLGWLLGEGLLLAFQTTAPQSDTAPSLIARPALRDLAPSEAPPAPMAPSPPAAPTTKSTAPPAPQFPGTQDGPIPPPPPEFRKRLERENGQQKGDIRITLIWNNYNDLDLHCVDPAGEEIFFSHNSSMSGGLLDVDENVQPVTDKPVENIYWPKGGAPVGTYRIYVNHYRHHSGLSRSETPFQVNLLVEGRQENFEGVISFGNPKRLIHSFSVRPVIQLAVPPTVEVEQGGQNRIMVKIARERFRGEVSIKSAGLHEGVSIDEVTLSPVQTEAELQVAADETALGVHNVRLVATGGGATTEAPIRITVKPALPSLAVAVPSLVHVSQSGNNRLKVRIARRGFDGDVTVASAESVPGISMSALTLAAGQNEGELEIKADHDAPGGAHDLKVTASAGVAAGEATLHIEVKQLPPALRLAVPDKLDVNLSGSSRIPFRIGRDHFAGPVEASVSGDLAGVNVASVVLQPDEDEGLLEIQASDTAALGDRQLKIVVTGGDVAAESPVQLEIHPAPGAWSWQMIFLTGMWTSLLAIALSIALVSGQNQYLGRGLFITARQLAVLAGGGAAVGLLAGGLSQSLLFLLTAADFFPSVGFLLGWSLLGGLLGYGIAYFVPNLHHWKASAAGAVGGSAGAIAFLVISGIMGDVVGRLLGAVALGSLIGVMVAFAELVFRSAWLEVHRGKEMITVNLGPEPIRVGSNKRQCTIWTSDAPDIALKYWVKGGQVFCFDVAGSLETVLRSGDRKTSGRVELVVRTGSDVRAVSVSRPSLPPPPGHRTSAQPSAPVVQDAPGTPQKLRPPNLPLDVNTTQKNSEPRTNPRVSAPPGRSIMPPKASGEPTVSHPGTTPGHEGQAKIPNKSPLPPPPKKRV